MEITPDQITPGAVFDTPFESGCVVVTELDADGHFDGYDSDGVLCSGFLLAMVTRVR
ncbi:hypothetical protein ACIGXM_13990 [Kitasatospora sp. NPDC052896]|uniref:hypothetical protein n=1 Tax=Kitasatospora sp. NPDC052896 TaxID=3364061 RepID=UPI0037CAC746